MRRLVPGLVNVLVVLLLLQWGGAASACLGAMQIPVGPICHADGPANNQEPAADHTLGCPLCAPVPPSLLPVMPEFPAPRPAVTMLGAAGHVPGGAMPVPQLSPQQPRAPPALA